MKAKGLCHTHNMQRLRGVKFKVIGSRGPRRRPEDRFFEKVQQVGECWVWTGHTTDGYGSFYVADHFEAKAHRWAYEFLRVDIPDGLQLDHLCRNRSCVNPWHLEPVTAKVNTERSTVGVLAAARAAAITHCKHGHEFTAMNTYIHRGKRHCRTCRAAALVRFKEARALRDTPDPRPY